MSDEKFYDACIPDVKSSTIPTASWLQLLKTLMNYENERRSCTSFCIRYTCSPQAQDKLLSYVVPESLPSPKKCVMLASLTALTLMKRRWGNLMMWKPMSLRSKTTSMQGAQQLPLHSSLSVCLWWGQRTHLFSISMSYSFSSDSQVGGCSKSPTSNSNSLFCVASAITDSFACKTMPVFHTLLVTWSEA